MFELTRDMRIVRYCRGWGDETLLVLALHFIDKQKLTREFEDYLFAQAKEENGEEDDEASGIDLE